MLQNIWKSLGFKKIMVYNTPHRENGRYIISDLWSTTSFSSGGVNSYSKIMTIYSKKLFYCILDLIDSTCIETISQELKKNGLLQKHDFP